MSAETALHGLTCPNCGGVLEIPEGQRVVRCPYCDLRSFVRGQRGDLRFQVPQRIDRGQAEAALQRFYKSNWAIARDCSRKAQLSEAFLVYLPFWTAWERSAAWIFGQKRVGSGKDSRLEPREVRLLQDLAWNSAACDVGEFGVEQAPLSAGAGAPPLEPFDPEALHSAAMVFEPVGSPAEARHQAEQDFEAEVRSGARLTNISQVFQRSFRRRFGLVYYPLWMMRYLYRGRAFQVVVDGYTGQALYGKAPGNTLYRAAVLVAGMALGALVGIDAAALSLYFINDDDAIALPFILFAVGMIMLAAAYRIFRYGEQYELRTGKKRKRGEIQQATDFMKGLSSMKIEDLEKWTDRLS